MRSTSEEFRLFNRRLKMAAVVLALKFTQCQHGGQKSLMVSLPTNKLITDVFNTHHDGDSKQSDYTVFASSSTDGTGACSKFEVGPGLTVGDVVGFGVKYLTFQCHDIEDRVTNIASRAAEVATSKAINAFEVLMAKGRSLPDKKISSSGMKEGLSRKDSLYNELVDDMKKRNVDFPKAVAKTEGAYFVQVLCNALWYVTNDTDGGVDHRNTLETVKCASICLFIEHNLDMLILGRCCPGHSWRNPAERVMSILNLGLQNCSLERVSQDEATEKALKKCGSMADIREMATKEPSLQEGYTASIEPIQALVGNRFRRLKLKEQPIEVSDPVTELEVDLLKRHLRELFPEMDTTKLQKVHTHKVGSYVAWKESHCLERQYTFQIRKCKDSNCCIPSEVPAEKLVWLPDPMLQEDGNHFKPYSDVKGLDTSENDRPTLLKEPQKKPQKKHGPMKHKHPAPPKLVAETGDVLFTAQNARSTVVCVECSKPRVIYSKLKLSSRQQLQLAELISDFIYTCGAPLTPPGHSLNGKTTIRMNLDCASPMETPYYSATVGPCDICYYCGVHKGEVDRELKTQFKTVLPLCTLCSAKGFEHPCFRPYGNKKAKQ